MHVELRGDDDAQLTQRTDKNLANFRVEFLQESREDGVENGVQRAFGVVGKAEHVEVPHKARREHGTAPARRSRSNEEHNVLQVLPEQLLAVVEAL